MFHVNAWGMPFATTAAGAKHVYPGPAPDPADIAALIENEGVTITAGVPTVFLGLLEYLDDNEVDLSTLEQVVIGGAAAPQSLIRAYDDLGVEVLHAWGMTETSPVGTVAHLKDGLEGLPESERDAKRGKQGLLVPGLEMKVVDDSGTEIDWNGEDYGELLIRGPWVTDSYFERPDVDAEALDGSWLRTGDIVTVDPEGYVKIVDRAKDVIKSGGEWISSQEVENALMAHDAVSEAAVVGVPHERYQERPVGFLVTAEGVDGDEALETDLTDLVQADYPDWWAPDAYVYVEAIPKTATGKFSKKDLREQYSDESLVTGQVREEAAPEEAEE
jgi:fatty-acyl-CoA synthase